MLFDSNEDVEGFATYIRHHLGAFDGKVSEQRAPYIANETEVVKKALTAEICNSLALKSMQPAWEQFKAENT